MLKDMLDWIGSLNRRGEMTAGELAEALMRYGADRPVEVRATPFLPKGAVECLGLLADGRPRRRRGAPVGRRGPGRRRRLDTVLGERAPRLPPRGRARA